MTQRGSLVFAAVQASRNFIQKNGMPKSSMTVASSQPCQTAVFPTAVFPRSLEFAHRGFFLLRQCRVRVSDVPGRVFPVVGRSGVGFIGPAVSGARPEVCLAVVHVVGTSKTYGRGFQMLFVFARLLQG